MNLVAKDDTFLLLPGEPKGLEPELPVGHYTIEHMLTCKMGDLCFDGLMQSLRSQDRRRSRRLKIGQPLKVRPTDPHGVPFEDINTTKNVSKEGFYFLTQRKSYLEGMRLFVTLPYHGTGDLRNHEYVGQVLRVDASQEDRWGVAVQLLSPVTGKKNR